MKREYETGADAQASTEYRYNQSIRAAMQAAQKQSVLGADRVQTELESQLGTLRTQAAEIRGLVLQVSTRVVPQCADECGDKQAFNGGYVGQAEEIRSIQSETIRMLIELSKYA